MNRRKSREMAMKLNYEMSINKEGYEDVLKHYIETEDIEESGFEKDAIDTEYVKRVLQGITENTVKIDSTIEPFLKKWKLNRISKIDLAILRVCTYEILFESDIPEVVSVNEAVELAKKYSQDTTGAFINGVLGNLISNLK